MFHNISCLVSSSGQLQEQGFSVEVAERNTAPQRSSARTIYKSKWTLFEKMLQIKFGEFSTPSVEQVSDFFMYLNQDLNRRPSTIDEYRTAIVDTLGPARHHISQSSDRNRLLFSFHRNRPKVLGIFQSGTFLLYLKSSQKHPLNLWKSQTFFILFIVQWEEELLIGSAVTRSRGLWITHRNIYTSSSFTS